MNNAEARRNHWLAVGLKPDAHCIAYQTHRRVCPEDYLFDPHCDYCNEPHTEAQYDSEGICKVLAFYRAKEKRYWDRLAAEYVPPVLTEEQMYQVECQIKDRKENPLDRYQYNHKTGQDERR